MTRGLLIALLAASVTACGWHLRGAQSVSLDGRRVAVLDETQTRPLVRTVSDVLADLGARVVDGEAAADVRLKLAGEGFSRRTLAGAGDDGIAQYELAYRLTFQVLGPEGEPWSEQETVRTADSYEVAEGNVLAGEARREELAGYLREEGARLMAARLQAALDRNLDD